MSFDEKLKELREKESLISKLKSEIVDTSAGLFDEFREHIFLKRKSGKIHPFRRSMFLKTELLLRMLLKINSKYLFMKMKRVLPFIRFIRNRPAFVFLNLYCLPI